MFRNRRHKINNTKIAALEAEASEALAKGEAELVNTDGALIPFEQYLHRLGEKNVAVLPDGVRILKPEA